MTESQQMLMWLLENSHLPFVDHLDSAALYFLRCTCKQAAAIIPPQSFTLEQTREIAISTFPTIINKYRDEFDQYCYELAIWRCPLGLISHENAILVKCALTERAHSERDAHEASIKHIRAVE